MTVKLKNRGHSPGRRKEDVLVRQANSRLETLIQAMPDIVILKDASGRYVKVNRACEKFFGRGQEWFEGKTNSQIMPSATVEMCDKGDSEAILQGRPIHADVSFASKDGETRFFDAIKTPVFDENGELEGLLCVARDITESKKAGARLQKEMERSKIILALYENAIHLTDQKLYDYVLDKVVRLTGSSIGFFHEVAEDQNAITSTVFNKEALENSSLPYEKSLGHFTIDQAGNRIDCVRLGRPIVYNDYETFPNKRGLPKGHIPLSRFMSIPVMTDGKIRFIFGVGNKSTDYEEADVVQLQVVANELHKIIMKRRADEALKKSEEALRRSEERFRLAMCGANDGLWDWDLRSGEVYYSPRWKSMLGYAEDELEDRLETCEGLLHPDDRDPCLSFVQDFLASGAGKFEKEMRLRHKDGSYRTILARGFLVRDDRNVPTRLVGTHADITGLREAERRANSALEEKEMLLKELQHRTKNNLHVISGLLGLQSMSFDDARFQQAFKETQYRIDAIALVHEKLYKSKDLANLDVKEYINDLSNTLIKSYAKDSAGISLKLDVEDISLQVKLAVACGLVINELLTNSLKHAFTGRDGGEIRIALRKKDGEEMEMVYSDNGTGLPEGLDMGSARTLGLRLVRSLVLRQLGGVLWLGRGNGTEFHITFGLKNQ